MEGEGDFGVLHFRRRCHDMLTAVMFFKYIQVTKQALRCTSRTLQYKMITKKGITDASDILRQEGGQIV